MNACFNVCALAATKSRRSLRSFVDAYGEVSFCDLTVARQEDSGFHCKVPMQIAHIPQQLLKRFEITTPCFAAVRCGTPWDAELSKIFTAVLVHTNVRPPLNVDAPLVVLCWQLSEQQSHYAALQRHGVPAGGLKPAQRPMNRHARGQIQHDKPRVGVHYMDNSVWAWGQAEQSGDVGVRRTEWMSLFFWFVSIGIWSLHMSIAKVDVALVFMKFGCGTRRNSDEENSDDANS